jgi:hypothetical protein
MKKNILIFILVVVILAVGGVAFYAGTIFQKDQSAGAAALTRANFAGMRNRTGTAGTNFISGSIISKDSSSITLQLPNNTGSKIIFYSGTTQISKMASGTPDDLAAGTAVSITGTANSDGSVTAQSIQIRPTRPAGQ